MRPLCLHDLDFDELPVRQFSTSGLPFTKWVRVGMSRIPQNVIDSVFYLYASRDDAEQGREPGGTGFVVEYRHRFGAPREMPVRSREIEPHTYGVTNWHVACDRGFSVVRLNRLDGGVDIIELGPEDWTFIAGKYDVAVVPLPLDRGVHSTLSIPTHLFLDRPMDYLGPLVGVGDDVFMIGLFIDHDGTTRNVPSARFGNISIMPNPAATIEQPTSYKGISYVVDLHSRTGFSGSPVFVYRTFASDLTTPSLGHFHFRDLMLDTPNPRPRERFRSDGSLRVPTLFRFLGIHWGQFPEKWEVRNAPSLAEARRTHLVAEDTFVEGMSGMSCVIPSWQIMEVLDVPKLKEQRERAERETPDDFSVPVAESAAAPDEANPQHREDFRRLLDAAARTRSQDDET